MSAISEKTNELFMASSLSDDDLGYPSDVSFVPGDEEWADDVVWRNLIEGQLSHRMLVGPHHESEQEYEFGGEAAERAYKRAPAVFEEWHDWIWTRRTREGRTRAEPSPDALILVEGYTRLAVSLNSVIGTYKQPQGQ
jgi:hypothetical protein